MSHSLVKPLSPGSAAMAAAPTTMSPPVIGHRRSSPPIASASREWTRWAAAPYPRNSSDLNRA